MRLRVQSSRDDGHLVNFVCVAASGQVVDGCVQAQGDRTISSVSAQSLCDLVADVARFDAGEHEGVGIACDLGAGELQLADNGRNGSVELHLAVCVPVGVLFLQDLDGSLGQRNGAALAGALGGEAQHGQFRVDAEGGSDLVDLFRNFRQLFACGEGNIAFLVDVILIVDVDRAVAHGDGPQFFGTVFSVQNKAGRYEVGTGLGLDQLQSGSYGVCGGIGGAAQQAVGLAHLYEHGAEVVALQQVCLAVFGAHLALAQSDHGVDHFVHAFIGCGIDDLCAFDVEASFGCGLLDLIHNTDKDNAHQLLCEELGCRFLDTRVDTFGEDDRFGFRLYFCDQLIEHLIPPYYVIGSIINN